MIVLGGLLGSSPLGAFELGRLPVLGTSVPRRGLVASAVSTRPVASAVRSARVSSTVRTASVNSEVSE